MSTHSALVSIAVRLMKLEPLDLYQFTRYMPTVSTDDSKMPSHCRTCRVFVCLCAVCHRVAEFGGHLLWLNRRDRIGSRNAAVVD